VNSLFPDSSTGSGRPEKFANFVSDLPDAWRFVPKIIRAPTAQANKARILRLKHASEYSPGDLGE
jgi:hypothetical protein